MVALSNSQIQKKKHRGHCCPRCKKMRSVPAERFVSRARALPVHILDTDAHVVIAVAGDPPAELRRVVAADDPAHGGIGGSARATPILRPAEIEIGVVGIVAEGENLGAAPVVVEEPAALVGEGRGGGKGEDGHGRQKQLLHFDSPLLDQDHSGLAEDYYTKTTLTVQWKSRGVRRGFLILDGYAIAAIIFF